MIISFLTSPGDGGFPMPFDCEITDIELSCAQVDQASGSLSLNPASSGTPTAPSTDRNIIAGWLATWDEPAAAKQYFSERKFSNLNISVKRGARIYSLGSTNSQTVVNLSVDPS